MSAPFVGCKVEVLGTSRAELNGRRGIATSFDDAKGRYVVKIAGSDVSLRPVNLIEKRSEHEPGSFGSKMEAAKETAEDWVAQAKSGELLAALQKKLPPGVSLKELGFVLVSFVLLARVAGLPRALALAAVAWLVVTTAVPAFQRAEGGVPQRAVHAGEAVGAYVATKFSERTGRPRPSGRVALGAFVCLVAAVLALGGGGSSARGGTAARMPFRATADDADAEDLPPRQSPNADPYALGFDDATAGRAFGSSLPAASSFSSTSAHDLDEDLMGDGGENAYERRARAEATVARSPGKSAFSTTSLMSVGILCKNIFDIGGGAAWTPQNFLTNLQALPLTQKALNAFLVARIAGVSPF